MFERRPIKVVRFTSLFCTLALVGTAGCGGQTGPASTVKTASAVEKSSIGVKEEQAIVKLEDFLRRQDISRSMRAQAMFRLAALKEDQARAQRGDAGTLDLRPSIELYESILRDFSEVDFIPSIHYFLGHALTDSGRAEEGQRVFRALVCHNHFAFIRPADLKTVVSSPRLPQDHDAAFWTAWEVRHPLPIDRSPLGTLRPSGDETAFVNPYPQDCTPLVQTTRPDEPPKFIGETWWRIGDYHFAQMDAWSGPYGLNRAVVAYQHALHDSNPLIHSLALYKLAWTHFKQQRYAAAVTQFVELLRFVDAQQNKIGHSGADLRKEAYTYIAASLTFVDFQGPGPDDPFIPRPDTLDTEHNPHIAEQKMHVAIERVRDGKIIPQNEAWTREVYVALILEFRELAQFQNMIETSEWFLANWPTDPRVPETQRGIAEARGRLGKP